MKNPLKLTLICLFLASLTVLTVGCSDDEGPANQANADGSKFSLSKGYIISDDNVLDDDEVMGSSHVVYIMSRGLTIEPGSPITASGTGDLLGFQLFSTSATTLAEGTYVLSSEDYVGNAQQFVMAKNYEVAEGGAITFDKAFIGSYGIIKVTKSGDRYTFDFTISRHMVTIPGSSPTMGTGTITGHFSGELEVLENPTALRVGNSNRENLLIF